MSHRILQRCISATLALLFALSTVMPALAAPPSNDGFDFATPIGAIPFSDLLSNTEATTEPNEQQWCLYSPQTVWYSFTPTTDMSLRADMNGSSFSDNVLTVYEQIGSGINGLSVVGCTSFGGTVIFNVQANVTYYLQAGSGFGGGDLQVNIEQILPPANNDFANATAITSLPFDDPADTYAATVEAGEPASSCGYDGAKSTLWYSYTPTTAGSVTVNTSPAMFSPVVAIYTGNALNNLTEVICQNSTHITTFQAQSNTTYFIQVGKQYPWEIGGSINVHVDVTPPPIAGLYYYPSNPSVYDTIQFFDQSSDPGNNGFQSFTWDFGDGGTSTQQYPVHQYARDGDYTVSHTVTTTDGRSGSVSQVVQVRTHDVAITKMTAPTSASAGQTRQITVSVNNKRYDEMVRIDLYKSVPGGFQFVGSYTQFVPVRSANRTTNFAFNYTFTSSDASVGKVTFKAIAFIVNANDAFPADNELYSSPPTKVSR